MAGETELDQVNQAWLWSRQHQVRMRANLSKERPIDLVVLALSPAVVVATREGWQGRYMPGDEDHRHRRHR